MALINCFECGEKISSTATFCPQCGYVESDFQKDRRRKEGREFINKLLAEEKEKQEKEKEKKKKQLEFEKILAKKAGLSLKEWRKRQDFRINIFLLICVIFIGFLLYKYLPDFVNWFLS